ncbi:MAG: hypothetical protein M3680_06545 [Myxococcota bacterium]|nr:hypothetical protein [Myxococcota bacterium]
MTAEHPIAIADHPSARHERAPARPTRRWARHDAACIQLDISVDFVARHARYLASPAAFSRTGAADPADELPGVPARLTDD